MSLTEKPSVEEEHSKVGDLLLCVRLDHDVAVDEDGADDGEGEERVREQVDGDATDGSVTSVRIHLQSRRKKQHGPNRTNPRPPVVQTFLHRFHFNKFL